MPDRYKLEEARFLQFVILCLFRGLFEKSKNISNSIRPSEKLLIANICIYNVLYNFSIDRQVIGQQSTLMRKKSKLIMIYEIFSNFPHSQNVGVIMNKILQIC